MTALSIVFLAINCQKYRRLSILFTYNKRAFYNLQTFTLALIFSPNNKEKKTYLMSYYHPLHKGLDLYFDKKYLNLHVIYF